MKKWSSFAVKSPSEIVHETSHEMRHDRTFPPLLKSSKKEKLPPY